MAPPRCVVSVLQTMVRWFLPDESRFYDHVVVVAETAHEAALRFQALAQAQGREAQLAHVDRVKEAERDGDRALRTISEALNATFVTPIDREDLYHLASALEIISDIISATANHLTIHHVDHLPAGTNELTAILVMATEQCVAACRHLRAGDVAAIRRVSAELKRLEHDADTEFRIRLGVLFTETTDAIELIKAKEFLEGLEEAVDRTAHVAGVLEAVLIKNG
jgi:uncharacterized protein